VPHGVFKRRRERAGVGLACPSTNGHEQKAALAATLLAETVFDTYQQAKILVSASLGTRYAYRLGGTSFKRLYLFRAQGHQYFELSASSGLPTLAKSRSPWCLEQSLSRTPNPDNLAGARCPDLVRESTGQLVSYAIPFGLVCPTHLRYTLDGPTPLHDTNHRPAHRGSAHLGPAERWQHPTSPTQANQASQTPQALDINANTPHKADPSMNHSSRETICPECSLENIHRQILGRTSLGSFRFCDYVVRLNETNSLESLNYLPMPRGARSYVVPC
jgi:hypothetical protein